MTSQLLQEDGQADLLHHENLVSPCRKRPQSEHQKLIHIVDAAVSKMVRERDKSCVTCDQTHEQMDCGHFRRWELMSTRFHPMNLNAQGVKENCFEGGRTFEDGVAIDVKYGEGWVAFLNGLSKKIEPWTTEELQQLRSSARTGPKVYEQLYFELRPAHRLRPHLNQKDTIAK